MSPGSNRLETSAVVAPAVVIGTATVTLHSSLSPYMALRIIRGLMTAVFGRRKRCLSASDAGPIEDAELAVRRSRGSHHQPQGMPRYPAQLHALL